MNLEKIPREVAFAALEDAATRDRQIASRNVELSTSLRRLRDECRREIRSAIDADKLSDYDTAHEAIKRRFAELANTTRPTTESLNRAARARREILTEAQRTVSRLGIDARMIGEIEQRYGAEARSAVEEALLAREVAPYVQVSPGEAPSRTHNPWAWRSAPYSGQWGYQWGDGSRGGTGFSGMWTPETGDVWFFVLCVSHSEDRLTGALDCSSHMRIDGADGEYNHTEAFSELQFWFKMPAAGLIEVWLYLQAIDTPWGGCLWDEWGISDAGIEQTSRPYLWIISPLGKPSYGTLLDYRRGEDEGCWSGVIAPGGQYRYAHLFSLDAYQAGQWVLCGVGIHDHNFFWVDDMGCDTHLTSRWFLKDVAVRSTGAP